jgi:predicted ATPase
MITKLGISYFKGLKSVSIQPKSINLLLGANGTGKTNFADLVDFLSVASRFGLKEALEKYGGLDEVRTKLPAGGRPPAMSCAIECDSDPFRGIDHLKYSFSLSTSKLLTIDTEQLDATVFARSSGRPNPPERVKYDKTRPIQISFKRKKNRIEEWNVGSVENPVSFDDSENLILNAYGKLNLFQTVSDYFGSLRVYNIDAALAKLSSNGSDSELDRTGSNLIPFLKRVIEAENLGQELIADLRNAVPYVSAIVPERILTYTTLKFSELDSKLEFRAQQMSDGTIRLLGLLAVLRQFFPPPVVVIEEPENALHAYAIKTLLEIAREVCRSDKFPTQVFFTSHSLTVVDEVLGLEGQAEVSTQGFVTRRRDGANTIEPAPDKVVIAIAKNLGRPSDFLREGSFDDKPDQLEFVDKNGNAL